MHFHIFFNEHEGRIHNMEKELLSLRPHERGEETFIASTSYHPNSALYLTVYDKQYIR